MSKHKTKWRRQQDAYDDNNQTILTSNGIKDRTPPMTVETTIYTGKLFCPFCLHLGRISEFRVKTKHGWSDKQAKCPECGNNMRMESLTASATRSIEDYAEWVFNYSLSGFWEKCRYSTFKQRLKEYGFSYRFWKRYKELKGEKSESYEDHLMRQQQEYAEEAIKQKILRRRGG